MTKYEIGRLIAYAAGVAAGVVCVIVGALNGNLELIAAGSALITTNSLAAGNVHKEPVIEQVPVDTLPIERVRGRHADTDESR